MIILNITANSKITLLHYLVIKNHQLYFHHTKINIYILSYNLKVIVFYPTYHIHKTSVNLTIFFFCILLVSLAYLVVRCRTTRFIDLWLTNLRYWVRWFFIFCYFDSNYWFLNCFWYLGGRLNAN